MKNKRIKLTLLLLLYVASTIDAQSIESLTERLEKILETSQLYQERQLSKIDSLTTAISHETSPQKQISLYRDLFEASMVYMSDSAQNCAEREILLTKKYGTTDDIIQAKIHRARAYSANGIFGEAYSTLNEFNVADMSLNTKVEYYTTREWLLGAWADYIDDNTLSPKYRKQKIEYLDSVIAVMPQNTLRYKHMVAERYLALNDYDKALELYQDIVDNSNENSVTYARSNYAMALIYKGRKDLENYERHLIRAAISDKLIPQNENLALQDLALYVTEHYGDLERGNRYLTYAIEDANFYDNKLRLLEIARKFPDIMVSHHSDIIKQNRQLNIALVLIIMLVTILIAALYLIFKQWGNSRKQSQKLAKMNKELESSNLQLRKTNDLREQYISLFIDLCATYIDNFKNYRSLVKLKIKARLFEDLHKPSFTKDIDEKLKNSFSNFDRAFVNLYPDFVNQFNNLLREGEKIELKPGEILNNELRIFALIRLGISDSSKIATLLLYSPQTIYNYRTSIRNRAINRDTFEAEVARLCK